MEISNELGDWLLHHSRNLCNHPNPYVRDAIRPLTPGRVNTAPSAGREVGVPGICPSLEPPSFILRESQEIAPKILSMRPSEILMTTSNPGK
jgi:hypothetical protein